MRVLPDSTPARADCGVTLWLTQIFIMNTEFPLTGLPHAIRRYVDEVSRAYGCPGEFVAAAALSVASAAIGSKVVISDGRYRNLPVLWFVLVARSGSNKSYPVRLTAEPLRRIDREINSAYAAEYRQWKNLTAKERQALPEPMCGALVIDDCSDYRRNELLYANCVSPSSGHGLLGIYPELKGMIDSAVGSGEGTAPVSRLLRLFDGEDIRVDRKGETMIIPRPHFGVLGDLQTDLLRSTFGSELFMSNGLNQRFLFFLPDDIGYSGRAVHALAPDVLDRWNRTVRSLYAATRSQPVLGFSAGADAVYSDFYNALQVRKSLAPDGYMASIYSKLQIQAQRLAGLVHMLGHDCRGEIDEADMRYAVDCMGYFEYTALRVYDLIRVDRPSPRVAVGNLLRLYPGLGAASLASLTGLTGPAIARILRNDIRSLRDNFF